MNETSKSYSIRAARGDFERYLHGNGIDIGAGGDPLKLPNGTVRGWDVQDGDATFLRTVPDRSFDFVYSSHCLEHLDDVRAAIENWHRVVRPGGVVYMTVPDYAIYEKLNWPSRWNGAHRQSFSLDITREKVRRNNHWHIANDLVPVLSAARLEIASAVLEDLNFDYNKGLGGDQTMGTALCQICVICRRID